MRSDTIPIRRLTPAEKVDRSKNDLMVMVSDLGFLERRGYAGAAVRKMAHIADAIVKLELAVREDELVRKAVEAASRRTDLEGGDAA